MLLLAPITLHVSRITFYASHLFHDPPINIQPLVQVQLHGLEQSGGFELLAGGDDLLEGHLGANRKAILGDDGSLIEVHRHEVRGDANDLDALLIGLTVGLGPGETGQERGVDVDDLILETPDEVGRENLHKARQDDEINLDRKSKRLNSSHLVISY